MTRTPDGGTCEIVALVVGAVITEDDPISIRHNRSYGVRHLEASGDLPPEFASFRHVAMDKQGADYVFDVPLDTAATITGYRHGRWVDDDFFRILRTLLPTSQPPKL